MQTLFFWAFHTYSGILRFSTFIDVIKVALSVLSTGVVLIVTNLIIKYGTVYTKTPYLTTTLLIYVFVAICLLICWRIIIKTVFEYLSQHNRAIKKVFIYGTQSAGISIAKMLKSNMDSPYRPVGFISHATVKGEHSLLGLKVYPMDESLIFVLKAKDIQNVIVSPIVMQKINPLKDLAIFLENNINVLVTLTLPTFLKKMLKTSPQRKSVELSLLR
jgi:FlaA1/EpsC-like NDP-sugar epimerase